MSVAASETTSSEPAQAGTAVIPVVGGRRGVIWSAPIAALVALMAHRTLPNRQTAPPTGPYPALLVGLLVATALVATIASFWRRLLPWARHYLPLIAGAIAVVSVWDVVTLKLAWMPLPYFPGPDSVLRGLIDDRELLAKSTYHSLVRLLAGYSLGALVGVVAGVVIGWFRVPRYWGMPILKTIGPIPATAYLPLVMVLFANPFLSASALIALSVWFPVAMLTVSGMASVPVSYLDVAKTLGAGRSYIIFRVAIPAALPSIFVGLFMGLGASFLALIAAETVGVEAGLGVYLKFEQGYAEYAKVYAALILMAIFFSGLMTVLFKVRDWVLGWQKGVIQW